MREKLETLLNDVRINLKLFLITIIGAVVPMIVLLSLLSWNMYTEYLSREELIVETIVGKEQLDVSKIFEKAHEVSFSYLTLANLNYILDETLSGNDDIDIGYLANVEFQIKSDLYAYTEFESIDIYYDNESMDYESDHIKPISVVKSQQWYKDFMESPRYLQVGVEVIDEEIFITLIRPMNTINYYNDDIVKIVIKGEEINKIMMNDLFSEVDYKVYLVDENSLIYAGNFPYYVDNNSKLQNLNDIQDSINTELITLNVSDERYLEGWQLVFVKVGNQLFETFIIRMMLILGGSIIAVIMLTYLSFFVSKTISRRLERINNALETHTELQQIEGNLGSDEIGKTVDHYNSMVDRIYELIYTDGLTKLNNRYSIIEKINVAIDSYQPGMKLAVMFLDVDNFKFINDTFGHDLGDEVIKATAGVLKEGTKHNCQVGRFGGDEFLILMEDYNKLDEVLEVANEIQKSFIKPIIVSDKKFYLTISMGIALYPENASTRSELIKKADLALFEGKENGKNVIKLYNQSMDSHLIEQVAFQNALKEAFKDNEFYMNYQPYYDSKTEELVGYEALIRWYSKTYGQVSPFKLIQNAEAVGLIIDIGEWVFREACEFSKRVNKKANRLIKVSVNISIMQLMSNDFYERFSEIINEVDIDPSTITLEMTETILIESMEKSVSIIERLRSDGFGIALDDFGTGYSSLKYLKSLPVTVLKIDRSFVNSITTSTYDQDLVGAITAVAHNRNIDVVAEGVETTEQLEVLINCNCDVIQGYYFSRPLSEEAGMKIINEDK